MSTSGGRESTPAGSRPASQGTRVSTQVGRTDSSPTLRSSLRKLRLGGPPKERQLLNKTASQLIRPLRVLEFLTLMFIFMHVIYITATNPLLISYFVCIVLTALTGAYLFVSAVDLIAQYSDNRLRVFPNTMFAACGIFFYSIFAIALLVYKKPTYWLASMVVALCFLLVLLYIIDVVMILLYWKRTCASCDICNQDCPQNPKPPELQYPSYPAQKRPQTAIVNVKPSVYCQCMLPEPPKVDLATSVSNVDVPSGTEADHSSRKVSYARRRQYVDSPTNARSAPALETAQVQTQASGTTTIEAQTTRSELEEKTVQTASKCDLCHRQLDIYEPRPAPPPPLNQTYPTCPAFVQLLRGTPYYAGVQQSAACRCVAGVLQVQQHAQQQLDTAVQRGMDQQIQLVQCVDPNLCGTLTNAETKQLAGPEGTITKLTFCIKSNNKTQCASQTMPYENAYTNISPVNSPLPSPKTKQIESQSRHASASRENPKSRTLSLKSGKEEAERDENALPLESLYTNPAKSGTRKTSGDSSARKSQVESAGRKSVTENAARKSAGESTARKSSGEGAVRRSLGEGPAKDFEKKAPESSSRRSTRQSPVRKLGGEASTVDRKSVAENVSKKSTPESERLPKESITEAVRVFDPFPRKSSDIKIPQTRKSDMELKITPRTSEVTRSKSHIELRAPQEQKEPSIQPITNIPFREDEIKPIGCPEGSPCAEGNICAHEKPNPEPEQRKSVEPQRRFPELDRLEEESSHNPVVQFSKIEEVPLEDWARNFETEAQTYGKPFINPAASFTKSTLRDGMPETYRKPIFEEVDAYRRSLGITKDTTAQTIESVLSPSNKPKRGNLFHKKNRVDPMHVIPFEEGECPEYYEQPIHDKYTQEESMFERRNEDICPTCHRPKPTLGQHAFHYYHIYRDKRGQIFCESCASPNTVKVVHKQLNSQKRLRCMGCGNLIQFKSVHARQNMTPNDSGDVCPTCGQP